ncbi:hypothetical protein THII_3434 [Thioploca ingrica]|uniref:SPOR domain-containing protein n=1 Tax=Thioploca ingrica TaxID=40754 RepID=A0A090BVZ8_9GAMM|nr:hypothetical protein THII_3434 [Thioploca ingrica]
MKPITMVRIYLTEAEKKLAPLLKYLHDDSQVLGVTVLRGISGFGKSGKIHSAHLIDLSFDLPVIVEFFDTPTKIDHILLQLQTLIEPGHLVHWSAPAGSAEIYTTATSGEEKWYVQAASFKDEALAQNLVQKIKDNHIATEAHIVQSSNGWYAVRLPPQSEQEKVRQQHQQLRDVLRINGIIKKLN